VLSSNYCIARFQPVTGLIYSVLLLTGHSDDAVWLPKFLHRKS